MLLLFSSSAGLVHVLQVGVSSSMGLPNERYYYVGPAVPPRAGHSSTASHRLALLLNTLAVAPALGPRCYCGQPGPSCPSPLSNSACLEPVLQLMGLAVALGRDPRCY
jgi:hypothetical protein